MHRKFDKINSDILSISNRRCFHFEFTIFSCEANCFYNSFVRVECSRCLIIVSLVNLESDNSISKKARIKGAKT